METKNKVRILALIILVFIFGGLLAEPKHTESKNDNENLTQQIETNSPEPKQTSEKINTISVNETEKSNPYFYLNDYDRWYVECIVAGEAGAEPIEGKMAVAQCILNGLLKENCSPKELKKNYKYSGWNEKLKLENTEASKKAYCEVQEAVNRIFDKGEKVVEEEILYFYAPRWCESKWHESQKFVTEIGGHRFFAPLN